MSAPHEASSMTEPLAEPALRHDHRVFLVEDEPLVRLDLAETLREAGYRVVECATAQEGADMLTTGEPIDAVVTDVRTPGPIAGIALARKAKAQDPALPVVVVSGHLDPRHADDADLFLGKPVASGDVCAGLERLLRRAGSQR